MSQRSISMSDSQSKQAGVVVYLVEELGDARLRCDQLTTYVDEALKLIENSPHKDHFFEVAGHLIQGVPVVLHKLQKSLQAVAMAANKIDYEELKRDLKPSKVEELENILEDVRIRQIRRNSEPIMRDDELQKAEAWKTKEAANPLPQEWYVDSIHDLLSQWEKGKSPYEVLRYLADRLDLSRADPPFDLDLQREAKSLIPRLKSTRRDLLWLMVDVENLYVAMKKHTKRASYKKQSEPIMKKNPESWKTSEAKSAKSLEAYGKPPSLYYNNLQKGLKMFNGGHVYDGLSYLADWFDLTDADTPFSSVTIHEGKKLSGELRRMRKELNNLMLDVNKAIRVVGDESYRSGKIASDEEKQSRFEEGKPADPTENMSPEDAKKWREMNDKYEDKFKKSAEAWKTKEARSDWGV